MHAMTSHHHQYAVIRYGLIGFGVETRRSESADLQSPKRSPPRGRNFEIFNVTTCDDHNLTGQTHFVSCGKLRG
jgi:hypothetical protein